MVGVPEAMVEAPEVRNRVPQKQVGQDVTIFRIMEARYGAQEARLGAPKELLEVLDGHEHVSEKWSMAEYNYELEKQKLAVQNYFKTKVRFINY